MRGKVNNFLKQLTEKRFRLNQPIKKLAPNLKLLKLKYQKYHNCKNNLPIYNSFLEKKPSEKLNNSQQLVCYNVFITNI